MSRVFFKALTVVAVSYVTWIVTTSVMAQNTNRPPTKPVETRTSGRISEAGEGPTPGLPGRGVVASVLSWKFAHKPSSLDLGSGPRWRST